MLRTVFVYEILFLMIKFVLNKINLTWHNTKLNIMLFFVVFLSWQGGMFVSLWHWHSTLFCYAISLKLLVGAYGWSHSSVQWKEDKKFPLDFPFIAYLLNSNYEKSAKCNPSFLRDNFFSMLPKYWQVSKYTAMLSEFSFPKKGKKKQF